MPSVGIGALSAREAEGRTNISAGEKVLSINVLLTYLMKTHIILKFLFFFSVRKLQEPHKLLQPVDKTMKTLAIEFAEYQVKLSPISNFFNALPEQIILS